MIEFTIKSPSRFDIRWFKVCWIRICNKKYTKPCSFLREKCYKEYIFSLKNTQFAIEMNGEQSSNSTFWRSSSKTNSLTTPDFFICSSLYWILQNTKRKNYGYRITFHEKWEKPAIFRVKMSINLPRRHVCVLRNLRGWSHAKKMRVSWAS